MKLRPLVLLLLSPALAVSMSASSLGLGGCRAITLNGPDGEGVDGSSPPDSSVYLDATTADSGPDPIDSGPDEQVDAQADAQQGSSTMVVDGIACTGVTSTLTPQTAPDGKTWTLDVAGSCGALGLVDVYVVSKDDFAYPQTCAPRTFIQMSVGGEGDAGWLAYWTENVGSSCTITDGPKAADQSAGVDLTAVISNGTGTKHTLQYTSGSAP